MNEYEWFHTRDGEWVRRRRVNPWAAGEFEQFMRDIGMEKTKQGFRLKPKVKESEEPVGSGVNRDDVIRARIRELEGELAQRARYGVDDHQDGTVLTWQKAFPDSDKAFTYAAVKVDGTWHVTGRTMPAYCTWDKLVELWTTGVVVESVLRAATWEPIGPKTEENKS